MDYNKLMKEEMSSIPKGKKLLLHACCAPCSSAVLERLHDVFDITIYYYNPNITDKDEYQKRLDEIHNFVNKLNIGIDVIDGDYDPNEFFEIAKGLEEEKERGPRCYKCYKLRLGKTAEVAEKLGYSYFTTTLSLSPYKNSDWINEIGKELDSLYFTNYLYSDFKKENGYKRSIELSKKYNLYRQDYCGCIYSKK